MVTDLQSGATTCAVPISLEESVLSSATSAIALEQQRPTVRHIARRLKSNKSSTLKRLQEPPKEKKQAVIRAKKLRGEEHINHVGHFVEAKTVGPDCNCKRLKCFINVSPVNRTEIFKQFYALKSKNQQDSYLAAFMSVKEIKQRRPRKQHKQVHNVTTTTDSDSEADHNRSNINQSSHSHAASVYYTVRCRNAKRAFVDVPVCRTAFQSIHGITSARIRRIYNSLITTGKNPVDTRGKYKHRPGALPGALKQLIKFHVMGFVPEYLKDVVTASSKGCRVHLPKLLSIRKMYGMFLNEYQLGISYRDYYNIFRNDFNFKFDRKKCSKS